MKTLGDFTLNLSLFLYFIHFIPQIYHNYANKHYLNISLYSFIIYFLATGMDLIYGIGFNYQWQYILIDIIYLCFLTAQQLQLLSADIYKKKVHIIIFAWTFAIFLTVLYLYKTGNNSHGFHINSKNNLIFWLCGYISSFLWIILWVPQIIKNIFQKQANGYSIFFWFIGITMVLCDITSAIVFSWKWLNLLTSFISLGMYIMLFYQAFLYKENKYSISNR